MLEKIVGILVGFFGGIVLALVLSIPSMLIAKSIGWETKTVFWWALLSAVFGFVFLVLILIRSRQCGNERL